MLPRIPAGVGAPSPAGLPASAADPRGQLQRALQPLLGQSMPAEVLARLNDGSFLVNVAGNGARMQLPPGTQVGADIVLTLLALDPRPTFQIGAGRDAGTVTLAYAEAEHEALAAGNAAHAAGAAPRSLAAILLSKAPLTPAGQLPGFDPSAPATTLSVAARAIAKVLSLADGAAPSALIGKSALMDPAAIDPARLAQTLHDTVGASGLFYESHVAEWADGKRALPDLLREPQMAPAARAPGADLAAAQLVNLQLHTQEQARVQWRGEAWPGQKMEWDIHKDAPGGGQGGRDEAAPAWRSGVRFQFPMLGAVTASVALVGGRLHIQMQTGSEEAGAALRLHAPALELALDAAGAPLSSLTIGLRAEDGDAV
ncbi:MAG TPA: flagellar hook-length control protein FliK [Janthinobacterium sp.]|nr:flagellar hook-length control protein FliK [Janthinobacterium sp.]